MALPLEGGGGSVERVNPPHYTPHKNTQKKKKRNIRSFVSERSIKREREREDKKNGADHTHAKAAFTTRVPSMLRWGDLR